MHTELFMDRILFAKLNENATIPTKRQEDGCYDLYACFDENEIMIQPHEIKLISTGLASVIPSNLRIAFRERGSNTKSNLILMAGQIDSGYRGEYFVAVYNTQHIPIEISKSIDDYEYTEDFIRVPYSKAICQFAVEEIPNVEIIEVSKEDLQKYESKRGTGCLGSSLK